MLGPITYLDAALIAVCFISGLLAMYRGFAREMLSIISWVVAAGAVLFFVLNYKPLAQEMAQQMGTQVAVAQIALGAGIFLVVLIIVHLITARISDAILDSRVGMVDRVLGFLFGVARGFILIVIPFMFAVFFLCKDSATMDVAARCRPNDLPIWVERAQSLSTIQAVANSFYSTLESHLPHALTAPPGEQQPPPDEAPAAPGTPGTQGELERRHSDEIALEVREKYHISVTQQARVG
jgi:membrane protein required for colicin V production